MSQIQETSAVGTEKEIEHQIIISLAGLQFFNKSPMKMLFV